MRNPNSQAPVHKPFLALFFACFFTVSCFRQEIITFDISVPQMRSTECSRIVLQHLDMLGRDAVMSVDLDVEGRKVSVTYNSRVTARKNIEHAIAAAGFDANQIPARPQARDRLPAGCR